VIPAKETLFNVDTCTRDSVVVCEGPFDVMRLGDGVVGVLGIQMTRQQEELLYTRFKKVVFLFDPEYEAQKRAEKYGASLATLGLEVDIVDLELDHDPGDLTEDEVQYVRQELALV
jgi:DNA primase